MKNSIIILTIIGVLTVSCEKPQKDVAIISTQFGDMVVDFFDETAPKHVESFKTHAESGYYNGT
ncbi:MAG TPA: peptidylprolyl isomerase, partial [Candidatus Marinimicrobia bacterium]|nr:peptidylprolyl isomerase [Candidatus Neomarinimicrobiota bacterium]